MPEDRVSVLQVIKCLNRGGAERLVVAMAVPGERGPVRHEVAVVRTDMQSMAGELRRAGVPVHDLGAGGDLDLAWTVRLRRLLLTRRYDVMHMHLPYSAGLARLVARTLPRDRRPVLVYTEHSYWPRNTAATRLLSRVTARWDDVSIAVAESTREALPARIRASSQVVLHGIDTQALVAAAAGAEETRRQLAVPAGHLVVTTVAILRPQKGYRTLLSAAHLLMSRGVPVTVLAAGAGPLDAELRAERDRLGLGDRFRFLGEREDVPALLAASDAFVLASDWECLPVAVMEAFALGTPVVATAVGELPRLVAHGRTGLLVAPGRPEELADALAQVAADPDLRARLADAAATTSALFEVGRARAEVEGLYRQALNRS